jgi:hypothetical protein
VLSGLDSVRVEVEVQEVLQGLRVAKNNTSTCVDLGLGRSTMTGRLDVRTTAEGTEARQIWFTTRTEFLRSLHLITVNGHVVELEKMIKRMWPKTRYQGGTQEYGTNRILNVPMGTLDRPILMGRVRPLREWCMPSPKSPQWACL